MKGDLMAGFNSTCPLSRRTSRRWIKGDMMVGFNSTCPLSRRTRRRWIKGDLMVDLDVVKLGLSL